MKEGTSAHSSPVGSKEEASKLNEEGATEGFSFRMDSSKLHMESKFANSVAQWSAPFVDQLIDQLQRREINGSYYVGKKTADVLRKIVDKYPWDNTQQLLQIIRIKGREIINARPLEFVVANVVRRVLCIIRKEHYKHMDAQINRPNYQGSSPTSIYNASTSQKLYPLPAGNSVSSTGGSKGIMTPSCMPVQSHPTHEHHRKISSWVLQRIEPSMAKYFDPDPADSKDFSQGTASKVKHSIFEGISELIAEIDSPWDESDRQVIYDLFLQNETILTYGFSFAVEKLIKMVNSKIKKIKVIVAGGDPEGGGERMAKLLVEEKINATYISDAAVFGVMNRVDKVVLGTVAILSSGGAITISGCHNIAQAANAFNKPIIMVAPLFKLTFLPIFDPYQQNELINPMFVLPEGVEEEALSIRIPLYDHVPGKLLSIFITDIGPVDPSYLYALTKQRYHLEDMDLSSLD